MHRNGRGPAARRLALGLAALAAGSSPAFAQVEPEREPEPEAAPAGPESEPGSEAAAPEDEEQETISLEDLLNATVSTATKSVLTLEQTPSIVSVFRRDDIERLGARQLIDLLRFVPGFVEVSSQIERNVAIRGIHASSTYHFVVLLDGLPMNDFLFGSGSPESFSLEYAERVEVVRGPGSAIYGANALMSVVNIITRRIDAGTRVHLGAMAGDWGQLRADASFSSSLGGDRGVVGSATFWQQDGTRFAVSPAEDILTPTSGQDTSNGIQAGENLTAPFAGAQAGVNGYGPSYNVFLKYQHDDASAVRLLVARNAFTLQRTHRQSLFVPQAQTQTPEYISERLVLDVEKRWGRIDRNGQVTLRPSLLLFGHEMRAQSILPQFYPGASAEGAALIYAWSGRDLRLTPTLEYSFETESPGLFRQTNLVVGIQAEYNIASGYRINQCFVDAEGRFQPSVYLGSGTDLFCVESFMLREGTTVDPFGTVRESGRSRFGDGDELRLGSFFQLTTFLPHEVGLVLGGRIDYNISYEPQFSPRVALVAPFQAGFYSKAQFSSAFVYPAFLYRNGNSLSDYQGNPDIKPQSIRSVEALLGWKSEMVRLEVNGYYNDVRGFITFDLRRSAQSGQYRFSNQGDVKVVGLEATSKLRLLGGRLSLDLQGSFARPLASTSPGFLVDGELGGPTKYPQLTGMAVVTASPLEGLRLTVDASLSSRIKQSIAPEAQFQGIMATDGLLYDTLSAADFDTREMTVGATASFALGAQWRLDLSATNLLNRRAYRPGSVLIPYLAEGRRVNAGLSVSF
jgi:outer membrane receptor protein involved in Fe transport